jgi:hypothetical protein
MLAVYMSEMPSSENLFKVQLMYLFDIVPLLQLIFLGASEVYDESRNRWLRLSNNLPDEAELHSTGSALL